VSSVGNPNELRNRLLNTTIRSGHGELVLCSLLTTWYPEGRVSVRGRVVGDGVRRLGAQPPSVAAQSDLIVPIMPFVPEEPWIVRY